MYCICYIYIYMCKLCYMCCSPPSPPNGMGPIYCLHMRSSPSPLCGLVGVWHCPPPPVVWWGCGTVPLTPVVWWGCGMVLGMYGDVCCVWSVWYGMFGKYGMLGMYGRYGMYGMNGWHCMDGRYGM